MTTVAWDGKTLATDSQCGYAGRKLLGQEKIFVASDGARVSIAGSGAAGIRLMAWLNGSEKPADEKMNDLNAIRVLPDGTAFYLSAAYTWEKIGRHIWATGSGGDFAIGAMAAGKTAREAVEIAIREDVHSGGEVQAVDFPVR